MRSTLSPAEVKAGNAQIVEWLSPEASDDGRVKVAASTTDMIRTRVREGSIARNILTPRTIGAADLTPSLDDDDPRYLGEIEPDTPGGAVLPLAARPNGWYFFGKRYEARFNRLETPRYQKDTSQLLTYKTDLRSVLSDASLKDLLSLEDTRFIQMVNSLISNNTMLPRQVLSTTGVIQWDTINDDVNPASLADAMTIMNRSNYGLDPATCIVNLNFAKQMMKWGREAFGGDLAEEVHVNGFTERKFMGVRWLVTIKNWLVPDGTMFLFAPQNFIGETLILTDSTMHVRKDAYMVEFWAYQEVAQIIANIAGLARCDFLQAGWGAGSLGNASTTGLNQY
jgi:hypothetical protein